MKSLIKSAVLLTLLCLITSCSKHFLDDNLTPDSSPVGLSNIYISPDWQSSSYLFKLPSVKDADYEIISAPSWLKLVSVNGHISDSIGVVHCSVTRSFEETGIYTEFMTVKADGNNYKVPVAYINEGNPTAQVQSSISLSATGYPNLPIMNDGLGILIWKLVSKPDWLVIDSSRLELEGMYIAPFTSYNIPLLFKLDKVYSRSLNGTIVLSINDKENPSISVNVTADLGTPQLRLYTTTVNFSFTETSKTLTFNNYGNGTLVWEFKDIPEWLTITPSSGLISSYSSSSNVVFSCDRSKLSPGQNSASVNLKTNDSSHPNNSINVMAHTPGTSENIRDIEGNVADAVFNKSKNILYYVTSQPNKFIVYDVAGKTVLNDIALSKAPTSFAISEDWTKAAVGHNGFISAIDLSSNTVTAVYTLNYSVNDMAWAENNLFCYTQNGGSFSSLHWIDIANGKLFDDPDNSLYGNSVVKKVPNQPYLIATRNGASPSGFFAFDISTKKLKSYSHMDLTNFWLSENGEYVFAQNLNVYRTTSSTSSTNTFDTDISAIGKINIGTGVYQPLQFVYHSNNYLWILQNDFYSSASSSRIYQIVDYNYNYLQEYNYDLIYQPNAQTAPFSISANYVFANNEGTQLAVLCKGVSNTTWIIQFIPVK